MSLLNVIRVDAAGGRATTASTRTGTGTRARARDALGSAALGSAALGSAADGYLP